MFDWLGHSAGGETVAVFVEHVANRDYDAAANMLSDLIGAAQLDDHDADRGRDLLAQLQRLAEDQERLAEVIAGLAFDEERTQSLLVGLTYGDPPGVETADTHDDNDLEVGASGQTELRVWLLGSCRLAYRDQEIDGGNGDRAAAVLRFLAAQPETGIHKEQLAAEFWPDADERSARRSLHQVIYNLRRRLCKIDADGELQFVNDRYLLGHVNRWRDIDELERAVEQSRLARDLGDTETLIACCELVDELYVGDFLADHPYAEWAEAPRRHYRLLHREAAGVLLDHYQQVGKLCKVVQLAERLLAFDPVDEDVGRRLMSAHVQLGHTHLAAATFATQVAILADDYGLPPSPESEVLARELLPLGHAE